MSQFHNNSSDVFIHGFDQHSVNFLVKGFEVSVNGYDGFSRSIESVVREAVCSDSVFVRYFKE